MIRPLPTSSFGHLATGEQQSRQPPSPDNTPIPTRPTFAATQITAHLPKSPKSQSSCQTSSLVHLATGEQQSRQPPSPDNTPSPRAQHRRQRNHSPSTKSPQINPQSRQPAPSPRPTFASTRKSQPIPQIPKNHSSDNPPVQTTASIPTPNARTTQITAHPPNPQKSQFRQCTVRISRFLTTTSISGYNI